MVFVRKVCLRFGEDFKEVAGVVLDVYDEYDLSVWLRLFDDKVRITIDDNGICTEMTLKRAWSMNPLGIHLDQVTHFSGHAENSMAIISWEAAEIEIMRELTWFNAKDTVELYFIKSYFASGKPIPYNAFRFEGHNEYGFYSGYELKEDYNLKASDIHRLRFYALDKPKGVRIWRSSDIDFDIFSTIIFPIIRFITLFDTFIILDNYLIVAYSADQFGVFSINDSKVKAKLARLVMVNGLR